MIKAYINYPNPHVTAHYDSNCGNIQAQHKPNQRHRLINIATVSEELQNFRDKKYSFAATQERNDMWLEIDFQDQVFEIGILEYISRLLGMHYSQFAGLTPTRHC